MATKKQKPFKLPELDHEELGKYIFNGKKQPRRLESETHVIQPMKLDKNHHSIVIGYKDSGTGLPIGHQMLYGPTDKVNRYYNKIKKSTNVKNGITYGIGTKINYLKRVKSRSGLQSTNIKNFNLRGTYIK
jgi:hypothetical protein